jgi:hypothetical protein
MSVVNLPRFLSFWTVPFVLYLVFLIHCIGGDCVKSYRMVVKYSLEHGNNNYRFFCTSLWW